MNIFEKFSQMKKNIIKKEEQQLTQKDIILQRELPRIIEYFNSINMPIEDFIKLQANRNIKNIEFAPLNDGRCGLYSKGKIYINSNASEDVQNLTLVHEMLHAITHRTLISRGFFRKVDKSVCCYGEVGRGIDEVITETTAEKITGIENSKTYMNARSFYEILKTVVGEEYFLKDYICGTNTVSERISQFYGSQMLELYNRSNFFMDTASLCQFKIGELNKTSEDYNEKLKVYLSIIEKSYASLNAVVPIMSKLCIEQHKANWYKAHSWELTPEQKAEYNENAVKVVEEYKKTHGIKENVNSIKEER